MPYNVTLALMNWTRVLITDSGGMQEEATFFGIPTLITRKRSDRIESVLSNNAILVGADTDKILMYTRSILLNKNDMFTTMSKRNLPFGNGSASALIRGILKANIDLRGQGKQSNLIFF